MDGTCDGDRHQARWGFLTSINGGCFTLGFSLMAVRLLPLLPAAAVAACVCCFALLDCLVCLDYVYECSNCLFVEV